MNFLHNSEILTQKTTNFCSLKICSQLMKLLLPRDEYAVMNIFRIIFKDNEILSTFFLGYGINSDCITNQSKPYYEYTEPITKLSFTVPHNNPYLPLDSEWFIKPILFSKKANFEGETSKETQLNSLCKFYELLIITFSLIVH